MNLALAFAASARDHAEKPAVFYGAQECRYDQVMHQASQVARRLIQDCHVQPGDRVAIWLKNCPEFVPALFGILLAGGVVVPVNNFLKADEVHFMLEDAGIDTVISEPGMAPAIDGLAARRPSLKCLMTDTLDLTGALPQPSPANAPESFPGNDRLETDLAVIIYTSGTTGKPKGAMLSHRNLLSNVASCREVLQAVPLDRFVVLLPMFHSFMLCVGVFLPILVGGSMVVVKSLNPPKNILAEILQHKGSILPAIPQFFRTLAHATLPADFPLRLCLSGGAPLPAEILREFKANMTIPLIEGYGLSEASPVVSLNPVAGPWKDGSIGVPIPGVSVTIQTDDGAMLPVGEQGELCVRGPNVMLGYWNQAEETAKVLSNDWLRTGDIGYQDSDGYFFITDRKKDMLLVNGINVYPREIEEIIYQFAGIKEAAVIGLPDRKKGEMPVAFVAMNEGAHLDESALLQFIRAKLADYKIPKRITVLPSLPRNATGKILKTQLRSLSHPTA